MPRGMKRTHTHLQHTTTPKRRRRRKARRHDPTVAAHICPSDLSGPRIPTLLREFAEQTTVKSHLQWLRHLQEACEKQGCYVSECATGSYFSQTHGAKSLANAVTMFLTYYVPRRVELRGDDEWREILAALRVFHSFCVKRGYVKEDGVLVTALFRLRTFCICTIPNRISQLARDGFWGTLENHDSRSLIDPDTATLGAHAEDEQTEPYDEWEGVLGDEMPLCVEQVMPDGWIMACDDPEEGEYTKAFLCLPVDVARLGMKGMSLSRIKLALRKGVWRPVLHDALYVGKAYPPDDVFYY